VTLLFSDKKSEEEKGVCFKMQKKAMVHPKKRGFWRRFGVYLFSAPDERADKNAFFVFGF